MISAMSTPDLEHRFVLGGRGYHVHVVVDEPRPRPTDIANDDFDEAIFISRESSSTTATSRTRSHWASWKAF
jgi:hypothetical protein